MYVRYVHKYKESMQRRKNICSRNKTRHSFQRSSFHTTSHLHPPNSFHHHHHHSHSHYTTHISPNIEKKILQIQHSYNPKLIKRKKPVFRYLKLALPQQKVSLDTSQNSVPQKQNKQNVVVEKVSVKTNPRLKAFLSKQKRSLKVKLIQQAMKTACQLSFYDSLKNVVTSLVLRKEESVIGDYHIISKLVSDRISNRHFFTVQAVSSKKVITQSLKLSLMAFQAMRPMVNLPLDEHFRLEKDEVVFLSEEGVEIRVRRLLRLQHRLRLFIAKRKLKMAMRQRGISFVNIRKYQQYGIPILFTCYLQGKQDYHHFIESIEHRSKGSRIFMKKVEKKYDPEMPDKIGFLTNPSLFADPKQFDRYMKGIRCIQQKIRKVGRRMSTSTDFDFKLIKKQIMRDQFQYCLISFLSRKMPYEGRILAEGIDARYRFILKLNSYQHRIFLKTSLPLSQLIEFSLASGTLQIPERSKMKFIEKLEIQSSRSEPDMFKEERQHSRLKRVQRSIRKAISIIQHDTRIEELNEDIDIADQCQFKPTMTLHFRPLIGILESGQCFLFRKELEFHNEKGKRTLMGNLIRMSERHYAIEIDIGELMGQTIETKIEQIELVEMFGLSVLGHELQIEGKERALACIKF